MKISVSIPDELLQKVDAETQNSSINRSALICNALRDYLTNLEAKRMLPKLKAAIELASAGKDLSEDDARDIDAFLRLASMIK